MNQQYSKRYFERLEKEYLVSLGVADRLLLRSVLPSLAFGKTEYDALVALGHEPHLSFTKRLEPKIIPVNTIQASYGNQELVGTYLRPGQFQQKIFM